jgi:hypothetical protein
MNEKYYVQNQSFYWDAFAWWNPLTWWRRNVLVPVFSVCYDESSDQIVDGQRCISESTFGLFQTSDRAEAERKCAELNEAKQ